MEGMMPDIVSPRTPDRPERLIECEEALEGALQDLVWRAMQAGWDEDEACNAIASLADHHILAMYEQPETEKPLRKAKRKRKSTRSPRADVT
jgi:hypothetical protein